MKARFKEAAPFGPDDIATAAAIRPSEQPGATEPNAAFAKLIEVAGSCDRHPPVSRVVLTGSVRAFDLILLLLAGWIAHISMPAVDSVSAGVVIATVAALAATAFKALRIHRLHRLRRPWMTLPRMAAVLGLLCGTAAAGQCWWLGRPVGAAAWLGLWFCIGTVFLAVGRLAMARYVAALTRLGRLERRTVVVGGGKPGEDFIEALASSDDPDLRILGVFDDRNDNRSPLILAGHPKLGSVSDLVALARKIRIDLIIFTLPITAEQRLLEMLKKLWVLPTDIRLAAHRDGLRFRPQSYSYVGGVPVLDMFDKPIADWDVIIKAVFDRVVGTVALIALAPVLLLTALAVKLDSRGPVFFKQPRHGFNNEVVEVFKFRSLYADQSDYAAAKLVTKDDPRVTRVGRFIRKTSLDELPQLINVVFRGDLSLVGPRPHAVKAQLASREYADVVDGYFARHRVKPGITGWAQINGWRGETDTPFKIQKRVEHDLAYIENWSILFDVWILLRTPLALLRTENAY